MSKILIKIIRRKDVEAAAHAETRIAGVTEQEAPVGEARKERRLHREINETVSKWIPEHNKNNRAAEIDAVRRFFGSELPLNKT